MPLEGVAGPSGPSRPDIDEKEDESPALRKAECAKALKRLDAEIGKMLGVEGTEIDWRERQLATLAEVVETGRNAALILSYAHEPSALRLEAFERFAVPHQKMRVAAHKVGEDVALAREQRGAAFREASEARRAAAAAPDNPQLQGIAERLERSFRRYDRVLREAEAAQAEIRQTLDGLDYMAPVARQQNEWLEPVTPVQAHLWHVPSPWDEMTKPAPIDREAAGAMIGAARDALLQCLNEDTRTFEFSKLQGTSHHATFLKLTPAAAVALRDYIELQSGIRVDKIDEPVVAEPDEIARITQCEQALGVTQIIARPLPALRDHYEKDCRGLRELETFHLCLPGGASRNVLLKFDNGVGAYATGVCDHLRDAWVQFGDADPVRLGQLEASADSRAAADAVMEVAAGENQADLYALWDATLELPGLRNDEDFRLARVELRDAMRGVLRKKIDGDYALMLTELSPEHLKCARYIGGRFFNWLQQVTLDAGSASGITSAKTKGARGYADFSWLGRIASLRWVDHEDAGLDWVLGYNFMNLPPGCVLNITCSGHALASLYVVTNPGTTVFVNRRLCRVKDNGDVQVQV